VAYVRDKNGNYKRTVRCGYCYETGHNKSSCPQRRENLKKNIDAYKKDLATNAFADDWERGYTERNLARCQEELKSLQSRGKGRKCSYCKEEGHTRRTCPLRKADIKSEAYKIKHAREILAPRMEAAGIGPGALVVFEDDIYTVESVDYSAITQTAIPDERQHHNYSRVISARSFPSDYYPRGYVRTFAIPESITNVNNVEISRWAMSNCEIASSAHTASLPSDFTDLEGCIKDASKLDIFNDGERPYQYKYPED